MMLVKRCLIILGILFLTVSLITLGSQAVESRKDTFIVATSEAVTGNWDPTTHTNLGQLIIEDVIFDKLFKTPCYSDDPLKLVPALALSYKRIDDLTMEFKLREGVKFHDGSEFDAEDIKASVEYYSDPTKPGFFWIQSKYKGEVVDKYTIRIKSEKPTASMIWGLSFIPIMSSEDIKNPKLLSQRPNGTGAYKYVKQDRDSTVCVVNNQYWRTPPKVKNFHFRYIGDVNTRLMALLTEEVDAAERLNPEQVPIARNSGYIDIQIVKGVEPVFIHFRCSKYPFKDNVALRRAMAYAIDREAIIEGLMGVAGYLIYAHIPPTKLGYAEVPDFPRFDPEMAKKLLKEAGYPGGKGLPELIFNSPVGRYPKDKEWATFVTAQWRAIGIPVKLIVGDPAAWGDKLYNPEQGHIITCGWCTASPEPDMILFMQWRGGMSVITFLDDPEINASLDKENREIDLEKRCEILSKETLPLLVKKMPSIPLAGHNFVTGVNKRIKGFEQLPNGNFGIWDLEKTE